MADNVSTAQHHPSTPLVSTISNMRADSALEEESASASGVISTSATGATGSSSSSGGACSSPASALLYADSCLSPLSSSCSSNSASVGGGCPLSRAGALFDRVARELWASTMLGPMVGGMQCLAGWMLRGSAAIALSGLVLLVWQAAAGGAGSESLGSVSAVTRASSFVELSVKTALYWLLHYTLFNASWLRPKSLTIEQTAGIGRRAALVLIVYELVSFALLTCRFQSMASSSHHHHNHRGAGAKTHHSHSHRGGAPHSLSPSSHADPDHTAFLAWCARFACIVVSLHTLALAAIVGMAAAVLARKENQEVRSATAAHHFSQAAECSCDSTLIFPPCVCSFVLRCCPACATS